MVKKLAKLKILIIFFLCFAFSSFPVENQENLQEHNLTKPAIEKKDTREKTFEPFLEELRTAEQEDTRFYREFIKMVIALAFLVALLLGGA